MTKQTENKLEGLVLNVNSYNYESMISVFKYVDLLVGRERKKIIKDVGKVVRKYHHGMTPKKMY